MTNALWERIDNVAASLEDLVTHSLHGATAHGDDSVRPDCDAAFSKWASCWIEQAIAEDDAWLSEFNTHQHGE